MKVQQDRDILALLPDLDAEAFATLREKLRSERCQERFPYAEIGGVNVQLDGHHRRKICNQERIAYDWRKIETVTTKEQAIAWVKQNQLGRRNLGEDELARLRGERRERVAEARSGGHSTRVIADAEGISQAQVRRDLEAANGQVSPPGSPERVKGKDGKEYTAGKPKGKRVKRARRQGFDLKDWQSNFGRVVRGVDELIKEAKELRPGLVGKLEGAIDHLDRANGAVRHASKQLKGARA